MYERQATTRRVRQWYSLVCSDRIYAVMGRPDESGHYELYHYPAFGFTFRRCLIE